MTNCTLKVRDRTTNKIKDVKIDSDTYDRLKSFNYIVDKTTPEPYRETTQEGKRQRIALKRDVMNFSLGDPRRVFYVNKNEVLDCRKVNLKIKDDSKSGKVLKINTKPVATKKVPVVATAVATPTTSAPEPVVVETPALLPVVEESAVVSKHPSVSDLEAKKALLAQVDLNKLAEVVSLDTLLAVWAETNGYKKQA
jgi:hypothetical protein